MHNESRGRKGIDVQCKQCKLCPCRISSGLLNWLTFPTWPTWSTLPWLTWLWPSLGGQNKQLKIPVSSKLRSPPADRERVKDKGNDVTYERDEVTKFDEF